MDENSSQGFADVKSKPRAQVEKAESAKCLLALQATSVQLGWELARSPPAGGRRALGGTGPCLLPQPSLSSAAVSGHVEGSFGMLQIVSSHKITSQAYPLQFPRAAAKQDAKPGLEQDCSL